ncbi:unnamed protein product [Allacma fusca]|uniref:Major facilitator superfamily (MFS) profile domain-containing protein n=1 Tax=Allacma fusca TaxID=39272 RepID=A0A8J2Q7C9_9HEXA|nr:unnamed protein product [Allacma fusca]
MAGMTTGALTGSQVADAYGRRTAYYASVALMGIFGFTSGIVTEIYSFAVSRFLAGLGLGGFYGTYYIYLMEFLTPKWRTLVGCVSVWSLGIMILALMAYLIPSWRYLTCIPSLMALVFLCFYPFVPETPRWLLCQQRTAEAQKSLNKIARMNRKPLLDSAVVDNLQKSILNERTDQSKPGVSSWEIFTNSNLRYKMLVFLFGWFSASIVYYSMSFNTKNVNGNPYLNVLYMGLVDFPAFFSGILFNNWLGRRKTYSGYCIFASIFLVALVVVDTVGGHDKYGLLLSIFSYMGRFGVCGAWGVLTCFTVESFPTTCRSTALGLCALAANFGGIIAPQLAYLGSLFPCAPYFVFAGLSLITACSTFLLGETNKKPLENFAK